MAFKMAFLIDNGVAELDFVGPKAVFVASSWLCKHEDKLTTVHDSRNRLEAHLI
jgi:hypothetical protein